MCGGLQRLIINVNHKLNYQGVCGRITGCPSQVINSVSAPSYFSFRLTLQGNAIELTISQSPGPLNTSPQVGVLFDQSSRIDDQDNESIDVEYYVPPNPESIRWKDLRDASSIELYANRLDSNDTSHLRSEYLFYEKTPGPTLRTAILASFFALTLIFVAAAISGLAGDSDVVTDMPALLDSPFCPGAITGIGHVGQGGGPLVRNALPGHAGPCLRTDGLRALQPWLSRVSGLGA